MDENVFEKNLKIFSSANAMSFQAHDSQFVLVAFFIFVEGTQKCRSRDAIGTDTPDNIITNKGDTRRYKNKWPWRTRQPDAPHAETARETCL